MDLKELEKLIKLCHKYNVKTIATQQVSLTIESILPAKQKLKEEEVPKEEPQYSEEDILMWSVGQL